MSELILSKNQKQGQWSPWGGLGKIEEHSGPTTYQTTLFPNHSNLGLLNVISGRKIVHSTWSLDSLLVPSLKDKAGSI